MFGECGRADPFPFLTVCRPLGRNLDSAFRSGGVVDEAAPRPVFRFRNQAALHGVPVHVPKLLDALAVCPNIEVVVTRIPEGRAWAEFPRCGLLEDLEGGSQRAAFRLADEQVDMFRHDDVAANDEAIPAADLLEGLLENVAGQRRVEQGATAVATEGDEVEAAGLLISLEPLRHGTGVSVLRSMDRDWRHGPHPIVQNRDDKGGAPIDLLINFVWEGYPLATL